MVECVRDIAPQSTRRPVLATCMYVGCTHVHVTHCSYLCIVEQQPLVVREQVGVSPVAHVGVATLGKLFVACSTSVPVRLAAHEEAKWHRHSAYDTGIVRTGSLFVLVQQGLHLVLPVIFGIEDLAPAKLEHEDSVRESS